MTRKPILLETRKLSKSYPIGAERRQPVLKELDFTLDQGSAVAITGPSGSGKTTLLNLLGTLDRPDSGEILFRGKDILSLGERDLDRFRNESLGFVFQQHHLLPQFSLLENVLLPAVPGPGVPAVRDRAEELIGRVGLTEFRDKYPHQLSGGECQRTAVIRALVNRPSLVLADEPTGSLDRENSLNLFKLLLELNREEGCTLVVVTHSNELASMLDKNWSLVNGNLEADKHS